MIYTYDPPGHYCYFEVFVEFIIINLFLCPAHSVFYTFSQLIEEEFIFILNMKTFIWGYRIKLLLQLTVDFPSRQSRRGGNEEELINIKEPAEPFSIFTVCSLSKFKLSEDEEKEKEGSVNMWTPGRIL